MTYHFVFDVADIERNLAFHHDKSNAKLLQLVEHYQQLAEGNSHALDELKQRLDDG